MSYFLRPKYNSAGFKLVTFDFLWFYYNYRKRGGYQEERKENERWNRKERKKMRDGVNGNSCYILFLI